MSASWSLMHEGHDSRFRRVLRGGSRLYLHLLLMVALLLSLACSEAAFSITTQELIEKIETKSSTFDAKVRDIIIEVEATAEEEDGEEVLLGESKIWRKGEKFRIEGSFRAPGMDERVTSTLISDGEDLWTVIPSVGKMRIPKTQMSSSQYADWSRMIPDDAKLLGKEKIGGRSAYKISFGDSLTDYMLWLDTRRFVPLKVSMQLMGGDFPFTTILYKSYRQVEGMWGIPKLWETYMDEELFSITRVKSVEVNSDVSDHLFDASKVKEEEVDSEELMRRVIKRGTTE